MYFVSAVLLPGNAINDIVAMSSLCKVDDVML